MPPRRWRRASNLVQSYDQQTATVGQLRAAVQADEAMIESHIHRHDPVGFPVRQRAHHADAVRLRSLDCRAGSELHRLLGVAILGGLVVSQFPTLYTTPVIYLYLDRLSHWIAGRRQGREEQRRIAAE